MLDDIKRFKEMELLNELLHDQTTGRNIIWATNSYENIDKLDQINIHTATLIKSRLEKSQDNQRNRKKAYAEVFTPSHICKSMNDVADIMWFNLPNTEFGVAIPEIEELEFPEGKTWRDYIKDRRLEITCGEAPYLVMRYDVTTGEPIPLKNRAGLLDRKLKIVNKYAKDELEWLEWVLQAYKATYGFEFQGDSLLLARLNLVLTYEELMQAKWNRLPTIEEYHKLIEVITWNIWQMDGLTCTIPFHELKMPKALEEQPDIFSFLNEVKAIPVPPSLSAPPCMVYDWNTNKIEAFEIQQNK